MRSEIACIRSIVHILFRVPMRMAQVPITRACKEGDEHTAKYSVTETPARVPGKLIRHLAPG